MWFENNRLFSAVLSCRSPSPGGSLPTFTPSCLWIRLKATRSFSDNWRRTCVRSQVMTASLSSQTGELTEAEVAWNKHNAPHIGADSAAWYKLEDQSQQVSLPNVLGCFSGHEYNSKYFPSVNNLFGSVYVRTSQSTLGKACVMRLAWGNGTHPPLQPITTYQRVYNQRSMLRCLIVLLVSSCLC